MKRYFGSQEGMELFIDSYLVPLNKPFSTEKKNGMMSLKWNDSKGVEREGYFRRKLEHPEHLWIFNVVKKECRHFIDTVGLGNIESRDFKSQWKNYDLLRSLKTDDAFDHTDIKHAYWQTSRREGYITEKTYNKVIAITDPAMKAIRNKALACMTSPTIHESRLGQEVVQKSEERDQELRILYKDIRLKTFRIMKDIVDNVGAENVYMYKIDGIFYKKHVRAQVEAYLNAKQYLYETENGFYMGENMYCLEDNKKAGGKIRRF